MNNIIKIIETEAYKSNQKKSDFFKIMIEMNYQFINVGTIQNKYKEYNKSFNKFTEAYLTQVITNPFSDILGKVAAELSVLDSGSKSKLCQHFTPDHISNAVSRMLGIGNEKEQCTLSDICVGSGSLILGSLKNHFQSSKNQAISLILNDLDELMCKVCQIQVHYNNYLHVQGKFQLDYIIYNHDALLEYEHFTSGNTEKTKIVGSHNPRFITNEVIKEHIKFLDREAALNALTLQFL
ncbi:SAM-dependent DNA methyltransferase [Vibrio parahaemolyticus]